MSKFSIGDTVYLNMDQYICANQNYLLRAGTEIKITGIKCIELSYGRRIYQYADKRFGTTFSECSLNKLQFTCGTPQTNKEHYEI